MGLEKVNSPSTGTIINKSISASTWTAVATGLENIISWELIDRNNNDFRYAFKDNPSTYRSNDGSGVGKDTALTDLYVWCSNATVFELEFWKW